MSTEIVILGAGFGGLELSSRLSEELGDEVHVTLIDKSESFVFGFSKLDVMFGKREPKEIHSYYRDIAKPGVDFRQETIQSIDANAKRVVTDGGTYDADILVVALGADYDFVATPGLDSGGVEFYSVDGAVAAREVIAGFGGGDVVVGVCGQFYKCPPAPYETAFLMHELLEARGLRDSSTIKVLTPLPKPIPISDEISQGILDELARRDIEFMPQARVAAIDADSHTATTEDGRTVEFDLLLAVPVHVAPAVVRESGLTEDDGWIAVDPKTLATKFPDVFAIGDVTSLPVPRAGVFAEGEARTVADVLLARLRGGDADAYGGKAVCYIEMGEGLVGGAVVDFLGGPAPSGVYRPPSEEIFTEKAEFGATRIKRWFA